VCITAQTVIGKTGRILERHGTRATEGDHMLIIIALLLTFTAAIIVTRLRVPGGVNTSPLGSMSERWLAEYRASHPT
jgi:hypothetical protein